MSVMDKIVLYVAGTMDLCFLVALQSAAAWLHRSWAAG